MYTKRKVPSQEYCEHVCQCSPLTNSIKNFEGDGKYNIVISIIYAYCFRSRKPLFTL